MSRRSSNNMSLPVPAVSVAVVAALLVLLVANWAVPCAGLPCTSAGVLANTTGTGATDETASIAQRVLIKNYPVSITTVTASLSCIGAATVEASLYYDQFGLRGSLVSDEYVAQVTVSYSANALPYQFSFSDGPTLSAGNYYWIVITSPVSIQAKWITAVVQNATAVTYIDASVGLAVTNIGNIPTGAALNYTWSTTYSVMLTTTIHGCISDPTTSSATPTPTATRQPSRTPQASASATPVVLTPITANVTSSFDSTQTALNLTAPASTNGTSGVTQPGVTVVSQFSEVRVGNRTLSPPTIQELTVSNDTSTNTTTYTYASQLENTTSVEQAFTFFDRKTSANFSGLTFDIGASSIKWSIHLQATTTANSTTADGLTLRYRLTGLMMGNANTSSGSAGGAVASRGQVVVKRETPQANMTTYLVPLFDSTTTNTSTTTTRTTAAQVELFDVALIDGTHFVPIGHSIVRTADNGTAEYVVELVLPGFNESLFYDPSIGLGVLLGRNDRDDGGGGSESNVGLIVGVAVAIPVAVALVLVVIGAALAIAWRKKLLARRSAGSIHYEGGAGDGDDPDQL